MVKKYLQPKLYGQYNQLLQYNQNAEGFNKWEAVDIEPTTGFFPEIRVDTLEDCTVKAIPNSFVPETASGTEVQIETFENNWSLLNVQESGTTSQKGVPTFSTPVFVTGLVGYDNLDTYDGTESWAVESSTSTETSFSLSITGIATKYTISICNIAKKAQAVTSDIMHWYTETNKLIFVIPKTTEIETAAEWEEYLDENNALIWYQSSSFSQLAQQYYVGGIEGADNFYGIGTTSAIDPLYAGDSIDFATGIVIRSNAAADIGQLDIAYDSTNGYFYIAKNSLSPAGKTGTGNLFYATDFERVNSGAVSGQMQETNSDYQFFDSNYTNATDFKTHHTGQKFIYPLEQPQITAISLSGKTNDIFGNLTISVNPLLPTNLGTVSATATFGKIIVTWGISEYATSYRIARQVGSGNWQNIEYNFIGTTYEDTNIIPGTSYRYAVRPLNEYGEGIVKSTSAVTALFSIVEQPVDFYGDIGDTATFTVVAQGDNLTYQWQWTDGTNWWNTTVTGNNTNTITMAITQARLGYQYHCTITDANSNSVISNNVKPVQAVTPIIIEQPVDFYGALGSTARFKVVAGGHGTLSYQWQYWTGTRWSNTTVTGNKTDTITMEVTEARNGNQYRCNVTNGNGSITSNAVSLNVIVPITITDQPSSYFGPNGFEASFSVVAEGGNNDLSYQWKYRETEVDSWSNVSESSGTTSTYSFIIDSKNNGYQYKCIVTDGIISTETTIVFLFVTGKLDVFYIDGSEIVTPYPTDDNYYYLKIPSFGSWEVSSEKDNYIDSEIVDVDRIKQYRVSLYDFMPE